MIIYAVYTVVVSYLAVYQSARTRFANDQQILEYLEVLVLVPVIDRSDPVLESLSRAWSSIVSPWPPPTGPHTACGFTCTDKTIE